MSLKAIAGESNVSFVRSSVDQRESYVCTIVKALEASRELP
jgi:hypothetical protein